MNQDKNVYNKLVRDKILNIIRLQERHVKL